MASAAELVFACRSTSIDMSVIERHEYLYTLRRIEREPGEYHVSMDTILPAEVFCIKLMPIHSSSTLVAFGHAILIESVVIRENYTLQNTYKASIWKR
jgi:hypothetical protein